MLKNVAVHVMALVIAGKNGEGDGGFVRYDNRYRYHFRPGRPTSTIPSSSSVSPPFSLPPLRLEETLGVDGSGSVSDSREKATGAVSIEGRLGVGVFSRASLIGGGGAGSFFGRGCDWESRGCDISRSASSICSRVRMARSPTSAFVRSVVLIGGRTGSNDE